LYIVTTICGEENLSLLHSTPSRNAKAANGGVGRFRSF